MMDSPRNSWVLSWVARSHQSLVHGRRVRVLAELLAAKVPVNASLLDIGCGDGTIASLIQSAVPSVQIQGIEIVERPTCRIPCRPFDGLHIPFSDARFDVCMFVDVLHHTTYIHEVLAEASRVSRRFLLIKDHLSESPLDFYTLKFMDWIGNRPHGVVLPNNYQSLSRWDAYFADAQLSVKTFQDRVPLYPFPFNGIFGRKLHFVALLEKN
jgi:ubiquinone/menaquinone biosynthesis C-methylase UbiE